MLPLDERTVFYRSSRENYMNEQMADAVTQQYDSLLWSVKWIAKYHNKPSTSSVLYAGLPRESQLSPQLSVEMLSQIGIGAGWVKRDLQNISSYLFPIILVRSNGEACIITERCKIQGKDAYKVILPETEGGVTSLGLEEIEQHPQKYIMLSQPKPENHAAKVSLDDFSEKKAGHWLFATLWRYRHYFFSAAIAALLANVLTLASTFFTMNVYDRVIPTQAYATLWSLAIGVVIAMTFEMLSRIIRSHLFDVAGKKADIVLGGSLFRQLMSIRMETKPISSGSFANQLREFESVRDFVTSATLSSLSDLPFCLLFIFIIYLVGGPLVGVTLVAVPLIIIVSLWVQWPLAKNMRENLAELSLKQGVLIESIEGLETLKATGGEGWMQKRWQDCSALAATSSMKSKSLSSKTMSFVGYIQQVTTVAIVVWGAYLIGDGKMTTGALVGTVILSSRALGPLASVVGLAVRFQQAKAALTSLNKFMKMPTYRDSAINYLPAPEKIGNLVLKRINFHYPMANLQLQPPKILTDINLQIEQGERIAILGSIGSGKSTLLKIISRLYKPVNGQMLVDKLDVEQVDPAEWHQSVGYVGQDNRLFHGSLRDNIIIGNPAVSTEEFMNVVRITGLDQMAAHHPMGYGMPVGEMGQGLSGGQRQLVALARTLLLRPKVLLLDEPTSSMDSMTELKFIQHLNSAVVDQTVIIVTHRYSLLNLVNRLIVMEQGSITADGPRDEIIKRLQANSGKQQ